MEAAQWQRVKRIFEAALEFAGPERAAFLDTSCGPDASLRAEIDSLLAAHASAGAFLETPALVSQASVLAEALPDPNIGRVLGPYRIVSEIARGGMGDVYEAVRDGEYSQRVAVKLLRVGFDSDFLRRRFRSERQILASLEHPNIARLLDGGATPDGQPYLVMELIDGLPLLRYCEQQRLSLAGKIDLFRQVCFAVHAAHQRLIVHRDLKPANILVTADGRAKLLDFGIARAIDPADTVPADSSTSLLLTPAYSSPEQIRGRRTGTASDIYSLGLILYELLAGERPFATAGRAAHEIARAVCEDEPPRPSAAARRQGDKKLAAALSGDLDNIILKALSKEPERRYASAERLAEDLDRHLAHRPVSARPDTPAYLARKFLRRHRGAVAAGSLILLLLIGGLAATLWQARRAERERARAERRFEDVQALASVMMYQIHDAIRDLPGSTRARQLLVESALRYLDRLNRDTRGDPALERDLAAAYQRVGDVQGNPVLPSLGDTRGARESYRKARHILESLAGPRPGAPSLAGLAAVSHRLGLCANALGDLPGAARSFERAASLDERAFQLEPTPDSSASLAEDLRLLGYARAENGDIPGGLAAARRSVELWRTLASAAPPWPERSALRLPSSYGTLAFVTMLSGDFAAAATLQARVAASLRRRSEAEPASVTLKENYGEACYYLALWQSAAGHNRDSLDSFRQALRQFDTLAAADPRDTLSPRFAAFCRTGAGAQLTRLGRPGAALADLRLAQSTFERLDRAQPGNYFTESGLADNAAAFADACAASRQWPAAASWYRRALHWWNAMSSRGPLAASDSGKPAQIQRRLARCLALSRPPTGKGRPGY